MTPTATYIAVLMLKLAAGSSTVTALIIGVMWFNDFNFKFNKKKITGGDEDDRGEHLRKEIRSRN